MLLVIDNYDSFTFNLVQYLGEENVDMEVHRNDEISLDQVEALAPERILISPGPCTPREAGLSNEIIKTFGPKLPLLGVCLGHQAIAAAYGADVVRATTPMHGRTSLIHHQGTGIFAGLPQPFTACRYHSLVVDEARLPSDLVVTARDEAGTVMGIADVSQGVHGVQFHPEAVLTEYGYELLANFLTAAGVACQDPQTLAADEWQRPVVAEGPTRIVTF